MEPGSTVTIGIPVYQGVEPLDVVGAYEVFAEMGLMVQEREEKAKLEARTTVNVWLLAEDPGVITTRLGMSLLPHRTFSQIEHLDVLWVPGGSSEALDRLMKGGAYLDALRRWSEAAAWVTSVCDGAMLLAAAGLLDGCSATTHWAYYPCLKKFPNVTPVPPDGNGDWPRVVVDGNRVTGGGVSSALDEALAIVVLLFGEEVAEAVQVDIQYFPRPPVNGTIVPNHECSLTYQPA
ncbi:MAG: DJ-1/PfpI family protein [Gemmatimonadetes bacterium]|nr:DJ-1/PfpI family protein [Gemmatimonadota bacterium]